MDQGSTKKRSAVHNFVPTVTKFCVMWEGLSLPQDTKFGNCRDEIVDRRVIFIWSLIHGSSWSLIHGSSWSGLIKVGPALWSTCINNHKSRFLMSYTFLYLSCMYSGPDYVITAPADVRYGIPNGARALASTVLTTKLDVFYSTFVGVMISNYLSFARWRHSKWPTKSREISPPLRVLKCLCFFQVLVNSTFSTGGRCTTYRSWSAHRPTGTPTEVLPFVHWVIINWGLCAVTWISWWAIGSGWLQSPASDGPPWVCMPGIHRIKRDFIFLCEKVIHKNHCVALLFLCVRNADMSGAVWLWNKRQPYFSYWIRFSSYVSTCTRNHLLI